MSDKSTIDHIFTIKQLVEKHYEFDHGRNLEIYWGEGTYNYISNKKGIRGQGWTSSIALPAQNNFERPQWNFISR
jgi:hypothetical protein